MDGDILLGRQPIFDRHERVWGYAVLARAGVLRPGPGNGSGAGPPQASDFLRMAPAKLAGGRRLLLPFSEESWLKQGFPGLPREMVALEISGARPADDGLLAACRQLKGQGHVLVLGDLIRAGDMAPILFEQVHILKVDYQQALPADWLESAQALPNLKLLAWGVETREAFKEAVRQGFHLFQGGFFTQPEIIPGSQVPSYKLDFLKLLNELARTTLDFPKLKKLLEGNPVLPHKLLKHISSALFGLNFQVVSVHHALLLLGEQEIRKWAALAIIHHLGREQPQELLRLSLLRAHFGEILAPKTGLESQAPELFLVGLLSLLDVYLGRPLAQALGGIPLAPRIKKTLLGGASPYRQVFALVLAHEQGHREEVFALANRLGLAPGQVTAAYLEALEGVEKALQFWSR